MKKKDVMYTGIVWIWAWEAVKPRFLRTVGAKAEVADAAMLQAKQARSLFHLVEEKGKGEI